MLKFECTQDFYLHNSIRTLIHTSWIVLSAANLVYVDKGAAAVEGPVPLFSEKLRTSFEGVEMPAASSYPSFDFVESFRLAEMCGVSKILQKFKGN